MQRVMKISHFEELKAALSEKKEHMIYELTADVDCEGAVIDKTLCLGKGSVLDGGGHAITNFTAGENGIFDLALDGVITCKNLTFGSESAPITLYSCLVNREPRKGTNDARDPEYLAHETDPEETVWENVTVYATMTCQMGGYLGVFFGKTCGRHTFTDCAVTVTASSVSHIGGFIGEFYGSTLMMKNCTVNGELKAENADRHAPVGGFIGILGEKGIKPMHTELSMVGCTNNARIVATHAAGGKKSYAGGFIGALWDSRDMFSIKAMLCDCVNNGEIVSSMAAGGFVGYVTALDLDVTVSDCINNGAIIGTEIPAQAGGLVGSWNSTGLLSVSHSVNNAPISGCSLMGGIVGGSDRGYINLYLCKNAGNLSLTKGSHVGGLCGAILEKLKCTKCINTGSISNADGETVGNVAQIASKTKGFASITDCLGLGEIRTPAINCTPLLAVTPVDFISENNCFVASEFYKEYRGTDERAAITATEITEKEALWQTWFDCNEPQDASFDPEAMWKGTFGEEIPFYAHATFCPDVYTDGVGYAKQLRDVNTYRMILGTGATKAEFDAYLEQLKAAGCTVKSAGEHHTAISGYWVEKGDVRMYAYISTASGEVRFILDTDEDQTTIEEFSYTYDKKPGDTTAFFMYGLRMNPYGINIGETYALLDENKYPELAAEYNPIIQSIIDANGGDPKNFADKNCGMMMVVKLADNSIIWIDGGERAQMSVEAAVHLDEFLHRITNTPMDEKVTIRAWFLTHYHGDHFGGFLRFMLNFHHRYTIERVMYSMRESGLPSWLVSYLSEDYIKGYYPDIIFHRLHTGETIHLGDVEIDVMYTGEDLVDPRLGTFNTQDSNDTTTVLRFRYDGMSVMALGDLANFGGKAMIRMYAEKDLICDVMQVPHHGWNHLPEVFEAVNPRISLYAQSEHGARMGIRGGASRVFQSVVDNTRGGVDSVYYAGKSTTGVGVENGEVKVVYYEEGVVGKAWDGTDGGLDTPRWNDTTPFPQEILDRY